MSSEPADELLQILLDRYRCPLPMHAARTQLLGIFASPASDATAVDALVALWGRERPSLATEALGDADLLTLVELLPHYLGRHVATNLPFRLWPIPTRPTRDELARLALMRREEIDAFVSGLFGDQEVLELTKPAFAALDSMSGIRALLQQLRNFLDDPVAPTTPAGLADSLRSVEDMLRPLEQAINEVVRQCAALRVQAARRLQASSIGQVLH